MFMIENSYYHHVFERFPPSSFSMAWSWFFFFFRVFLDEHEHELYCYYYYHHANTLCDLMFKKKRRY